MPAIPQYHQEQLATPVVGSPQIDNSGASLAGNILGNATELQGSINAANARTQALLGQGAGEAIANAVQQQNYEQQLKFHQQREAQAHLAAVTKAQEELNDKMTVNNTNVGASFKMTDLISSIQQDPNIHPMDKAKVFKAQSADLVNSILNQPEVKARQTVVAGVQQFLDGQVESNYRTLSNDGLSAYSADTKAGTTNTIKTIVEQAGTGPNGLSTAALGQSFQKLGMLRDNVYLHSVGASEAESILHEAKQNITMNWAKNVIANGDPNVVRKLIQAGVFDNATGEQTGMPGTFPGVTLLASQKDTLLTAADQQDKAAKLQADAVSTAAVTTQLFKIDSLKSDATKDFKNAGKIANINSQLQTIITEAQKAPPSAGSRKVLDDATSALQSMNSFQTGIATAERSAAALERSATAQERATQRLAAVNKMLLPENRSLIEAADAAYIVATKDDKLNRDPMQELNQISDARNKLNDINARGLYSLPGDTGQDFDNKKAHLDARLARVTQALEKPNAQSNGFANTLKQGRPWQDTLPFHDIPTPQEKLYRALARPAPEEVYKAARTPQQRLIYSGEYKRLLNENYIQMQESAKRPLTDPELERLIKTTSVQVVTHPPEG